MPYRDSRPGTRNPHSSLRGGRQQQETGDYALYTTIPIRDAPYPHGLGKLDHEKLEFSMRRLLGARWQDQAANEAAFWTAPYQELLEKYLKPFFDREGDIVDAARQATEVGRRNLLLGQRLFHDVDPDPRSRYWDAWPDADATGELARVVRSLVVWPLQFTKYSDGNTSYANGRHRMSYLRSRIQRQDPEFEVLVRIDYVDHPKHG
ncbi:hypothetical protein Isolate57625_53720 (plasmid) [Mycobacteroides abscessus subsp. abscessus]|uniref:Uncharacterized protein n=2 Tax=Mycobacteroides abscessus TaxID=36809 RepID=A0A4D8SAN0_9MYCO|nr:hypothetical protein CFE69_23510 [Mycobacteroides abscessus subsp. massiliense]